MKHLRKYNEDIDIDWDFDEEEIDSDANFIMYRWEGEESLCYLIEKNYSGDSEMSVWDVDNRNVRLSCYDEFRNDYKPATSDEIETYLDKDKLNKLIEF